MKKKKEVYVVLKDILDINDQGIIYIKKTELLEVFYFWSDAEKYIEELEKKYENSDIRYIFYCNPKILQMRENS